MLFTASYLNLSEISITNIKNKREICYKKYKRNKFEIEEEEFLDFENFFDILEVEIIEQEE